MEITSVRRQKRRRQRVNVYVDGDFRLSVAEEVAVKRGLRAGTEVDEGLLGTLAAEDALWRAREAAHHLLSYRQRTQRELSDRLSRKGFERATVDACLAQLLANGLLNDAAFARSLVRDRLRARPSGRTKLLAELRKKGVEGQVAEAMVDEVLTSNDESEVDLARRAVRSFRLRKGEDALRTKRRLYGFLGRRGFSPESIRSISDELGLDR